MTKRRLTCAYMAVYRPIGSLAWTPIHHSRNGLVWADWQHTREAAQRTIDAAAARHGQSRQYAIAEVLIHEP